MSSPWIPTARPTQISARAGMSRITFDETSTALLVAIIRAGSHWSGSQNLRDNARQPARIPARNGIMDRCRMISEYPKIQTRGAR